MRENRIKAQAQRQKNFEQDKNQEESATSTEEVTVAEEVVEEDVNDEATDASQEVVESSRNYKYPLTISKNYPARIVFRVYKNDGVQINKTITDLFSSFVDDPENIESTVSSIADKKVDPDTKKEIVDADKQSSQQNISYENNTEGDPLGTVTLPLQRDLRFSDNAQYETANLGVLGGALEGALNGSNAFAGATSNGQLTSTASALAASAIAKNVGELAGAAVGSIKGAPGAIVGASALSNAFEGLSPAVRSATKIASAPNQRTLFQQVQIRSFAFTFKMIANNAREAEEIRNIIKFFRQELYPEKIPLGESGVPLGYKFPNQFEIEIKNRFDGNPAFKIQRCYLRDVQTSFNATATGMYDDGNFIEADISLAFQEIVALDKEKVRKGGY